MDRVSHFPLRISPRTKARCGALLLPFKGAPVEHLEARCLLSAVVPLAPSTPPSVIFTDSTFNNSGWSLVAQAIGYAGSTTAYQVSTGGNTRNSPDPYRKITSTTSGAVDESHPSVEIGYHLKTAAVFNPSRQGGISGIDMSLDAIMLDGVGSGIGEGVALEQGGVLYSTGDTATGHFGTGEKHWTNHRLTNLQSGDFVTTQNFLSGGGQHPDFSPKGAPIILGFFSGDGDNIANNGYTIVGGVDNWSVTVHRVLSDLTAHFTQQPSTTAKAGATIHATLLLTNAGPGDALGDETTRYYLSPLPILTKAAVPIGTGGESLNLKPSKSVSQTPNLIIPKDTKAGIYYLIADVNANGAIQESDASKDLNNVAASTPFRVIPSALTVEELVQIMTKLRAGVANHDLSDLNTAMTRFGITDGDQQAAFLAQLAHESQELTHWREQYTLKPNFALPGSKRAPHTATSAADYFNYWYGNRPDIGNTNPGDGYEYRGRGPIQLTGKSNYLAASYAIGVNLVSNPDLVSDSSHPEVGFLVAAWYFESRGLNAVADQVDPTNTSSIIAINKQITKRINGELNGLSDRLTYYERALKVLTIAK